jgi:cation transport ATPase
MKTTSKTIDSTGQLAENHHSHYPHSPEPIHDHDDHDHEGHDHDHQTGIDDYVRLALMGIIVVASLTGWWRPFMNRDWLAFAGTVIGGFPIYKEAWENLRKRRMTMELSMTIALLSALAIGQFFTAIVIAFFVLFAELLEGYTVGGGRRAIENLINALPRHVTVRRNGQESELKAEELSIGEVIVIRPGERIPVDGTVIRAAAMLTNLRLPENRCRLKKPSRARSLPARSTRMGCWRSGSSELDGIRHSAKSFRW